MICKTKRCRRLVTEAAHSPWCSRCKSRRFKKEHLLKYLFNILRSHAKERGKEFSLTFPEYEAFCLKTDYHKLKGKTSLSLSIDRKDNNGPYAAWNIRTLTLCENTRRQFIPRLREYVQRTMEQEAA